MLSFRYSMFWILILFSLNKVYGETPVAGDKDRPPPWTCSHTLTSAPTISSQPNSSSSLLTLSVPLSESVSSGVRTRHEHYLEKAKNFPKQADLREAFPPAYRKIYHQQDIGSCVANALAAGLWYGEVRWSQANLRHLSPEQLLDPSRLFIYHNARNLTKDRKRKLKDDGCNVADGITGLQKYGVCSEKEWPYVGDEVNTLPPRSCYVEGREKGRLPIFSYRNLTPRLERIKGVLLKGNPIVFGLQLFKKFESQEVRKTGVVPIPDSTDKKHIFHALLMVGYDDEKEGGCFLVQNSWGEEWGVHGCCYIPYSYVLNKKYGDEFVAVIPEMRLDSAQEEPTRKKPKLR